MATAAPRHLAGGKPADAHDFILERRYRLATSLAPPSGSELLLDFGCGNGSQSRMFRPLVAHCVGVDVDRPFLEQASARSGDGGVQPVHYDGFNLPLADASVDYAISFEVLEHVADERRALEELHRVIRPEGRLVMSVPNRWWIFETHGADLPLLPWNRVPFFSWLPTHIHDRYARARIYRRSEVCRKLEAAGFEIETSRYITAPMDVVPWAPVKRLLRATLFRGDTTPLPTLATAVLVVARRS